MALVERGTHQDAQASVGLRARGFGSTARRVKAAGRDLQVLTQLRDRELGLLRVDPSEHYAWFLAKKAAAFFRMSRSMRNSRLSLRKAASSVRSSVVSPVLPLVRSARACSTQLRSDDCHETVRYWWNRCGPLFAAEIRKRRVHHRFYSLWRWHLDEVCVRINGTTHYLWRAVDHEGEVVEVFVTKRRDRRAALEFLTRAMKRYGRPASIVTDRLPSYRAAMKVIGNEGCQETGRWLNNRAENSHQPFRRREGAMARFRDITTLQKFTSVHASIHNHFNHQRHLNRRDIFKQGRAAALAEWRQLAV